MKTTTLNVSLLEASPRVRVRAREVDPAVVARYADALAAGVSLPPPVVFREKGTERYVIADGRHRVEAHREKGSKEIAVELREGNEVAALEYALSSNTAHGLPRSPADLKHCINRLMTTPDLIDKYRTDGDRADLLKISPRTFASLKAQWRDEDGGSKTEKAAKAEARKSAAKHTPKPAAKRESSKPAPKADKAPRPAAKQQSTNDRGWTKADEDATQAILEQIANLERVWKAATRAAQIQTRDALVTLVKSFS